MSIVLKKIDKIFFNNNWKIYMHYWKGLGQQSIFKCLIINENSATVDFPSEHFNTPIHLTKNMQWKYYFSSYYALLVYTLHNASNGMKIKIGSKKHPIDLDRSRELKLIEKIIIQWEKKYLHCYLLYYQ